MTDTKIMKSEQMVSRAKQLATSAHEGQVDKAGNPYINHPARVAASLADEDAITTAWLHDVVEDTDVTLDQLAEQFPPAIVAAVDDLTKRADESRAQYYARVRTNPIALAVKLADINDNSNLQRLSKLDLATRERLQAKYASAITQLTGVHQATPLPLGSDIRPESAR